jgi:hypothetical protein
LSGSRALPKFWTEEDASEAARAADNGSYVFLGAVAVRILKRMREENPCRTIAIVCGPITNGGTLPGSEIKKNLERFKEAILWLESRGSVVFNQMPFEEYLFQIRLSRPIEDPDVLLESFYRPIFQTAVVDIAYFLPGWENSHGATWENNLTKRLGIHRCLLL